MRRIVDYLDSLHIVVYACLFFGVVLIACFTRFTNLTSRMQWFDDTARDLMVAEKVAQSGQYTTLRPRAAASADLLNNSTLYYNHLAFLWSIGNNRNFVILVYTLFGIASLFAGWEIGRQIGGKWLALACFFLLAINTQLAQEHISLYQRNYLPSFALIVVMLALWAVRSKSLKKILLLHLIFTLGVLLHYALLTFAPAVAIVTVWAVMNNDHSWRKKLTVIAVSAVVCTTVWMVLTNNNPIDLFNFSQMARENTWTSNVDPSNAHFAAFVSTLARAFSFSTWTNWLVWVWLVILGLGVVILLPPKVPTAYRVYILFIATYGLLHVVFLRQGFFYFSFPYMVHYQPLFLLAMPIVVYSALQLFAKRAALISLFFICTLFIFLEWPNLRVIPVSDAYGEEFQTTQAIAEKIYEDAQHLKEDGKSPPFLMIHYSGWASGDPGWFSPSFLTHLEARTGASLATLTSEGNNLSQHFEYPIHTIYVICGQWGPDGNFITEASEVKQLCIDQFLTTFLSKYSDLTTDEVQVSLFIDSKANKMNANVFKISPK